MTRYSLVRFLCFALAGISFISGTARLAEVGLVAMDPAWTITDLQCDKGACEWVIKPSKLDGLVRPAPGAEGLEDEAAVLEQITQPRVHQALIGAELLRAVPLAALYGALAFALIRLGQPEAINRAAIRWLRRATVAAAVLILAKPLADSLESSAMSGPGVFSLVIAGNDIPFDLLLVGIAWVAAWALEQGTRANDELAEFI